MVRCSNPVVLRCYAAMKRINSRACPTPCSTADQTNTSFEMCQNSNDFCFENNTFAKKSQQSAAQAKKIPRAAQRSFVVPLRRRVRKTLEIRED